MSETILLVGLPGAGATTVGALLGQRLNRPFLDDEALLERTSGMTSQALLATSGEEALREAESRVLTLLLGMPGELVAAVPDAVIDNADDRARLVGSGARIVWLRCSIPVLARRLAVRLGPEAATTLRRLNAERAGLYEEIAAQVIDTDAQPAGAVANMVIEALG